MKIRPVILCGGSGTRLWVKNKNNLAKQFINFGGWTLFEKTLLRIKNPIFEYPIITTNILYLKLVVENWMELMLLSLIKKILLNLWMKLIFVAIT